MRPEDIDDLFKGKLGDHSSELPSPLWNRLEERMQQQAKPEHSVDALFKRKLENHGTPLSANLWNRLEERMNPEAKKVRPMWVWYAAACIGLLLTVVGFFRIDTNQNNGLATLETGPQKTEETVKSETDNLPANSEIITSSANPALAHTNTAAAGSGNENLNSETVSSKGSNTEINKTQPAATENKAANEEKIHEVTIQPKAQETLLAQHVAEPKKQAGIIDNKSLNQAQSEIRTPATGAGSMLNVEIILASATPEMQLPETVDAREEDEEGSVKKKALFAKKVAKQLWSIKNGEKPDLQELGLAQNYSDGVKNKIQSLTKTINL